MDAGKHLDLSNHPPEPPASDAGRSSGTTRRPFVGIYFACCRVYGRLYIRPGKHTYWTHCPRCGGRLQVELTEGDQTSDFITVK